MPIRPRPAMAIADDDLYRRVRDRCLEAEVEGRRRPGVNELRSTIGPVGFVRLTRALHMLIEDGVIPRQDPHLERDGHRPTPPGLLSAIRRADAARASLVVPERPGVAAEPTEAELRSHDLYVEHMARERRLRRGVAS